MVEYGFFNAIDGDRTYNADSFNEFFNGIISDTGVYKKSNSREGYALRVVSSGNWHLSIEAGKARIKGRWVNLTSPETIELEPPDVALDRWDRIVLRLDETERTISIVIIKGTPATEPTKPSLVRNDTIYDICLAQIYVRAGATYPDRSIVDTREDTDLCGYVKMQIGTVNAGIKEYRNVVTTTSEVTELEIGIPQFDSSNDLFFSNIGGVMFVKGEDYTISGTGSSAKMVLKRPICVGNTVEFRVIKAVLEVL